MEKGDCLELRQMRDEGAGSTEGVLAEEWDRQRALWNFATRARGVGREHRKQADNDEFKRRRVRSDFTHLRGDRVLQEEAGHLAHVLRLGLVRHLHREHRKELVLHTKKFTNEQYLANPPTTFEYSGYVPAIFTLPLQGYAMHTFQVVGA